MKKLLSTLSLLTLLTACASTPPPPPCDKAGVTNTSFSHNKTATIPCNRSQSVNNRTITI
jgi:hypothetical protein